LTVNIKNGVAMQKSADIKLDQIPLGPTNLKISRLGFGTWQWGDRNTWGYGQGGYTDGDLQAGFKEGLAAGINFFDTAETYGDGRSETLLGKYAQELDANLVIATKFMPYPWRINRSALIKSLKNSLQRLGRNSVELYQMHWPLPFRSVKTWAESMAEAFQAGLIKAIGVSNYNVDQMKRFYEVLQRLQIPLASNQVRYSLLNRNPEVNGVYKTCNELGVTLIAYSPLAQGMLTGKYNPQNPINGTRRLQYGSKLESIQPLINQLREIGRAHNDRSPAQVALNWIICKGGVPIPGAKNANQAKENAGALGWFLTTEEIKILDLASVNV
jgi:aryl-alcohol dehydrogenase-like predicted oxidoreductase